MKPIIASSLIFVLLIQGGFAFAGEPGGKDGDTKPDAVLEAIDRLASPETGARSAAAVELAEMDDGRVVRALSARLGAESNYHVLLALHFALANHGEWESLRFLLASLEKRGHMGSSYLGRVTGKDFGWETDLWKAWFAGTDAGKFKAFARRRLERASKKKAWGEFASLFRKRAFEDIARDESERLTDEERKRLETMPEAKAWALFEKGIGALQERGDRASAAKAFRELAAKYGTSYYAETARELAGLLDGMVREDEAWREPEDPNNLEIEACIAYYVYHLRDVVARQFCQPGRCSVLQSLGPEAKPNAVFDLKRIGFPAVPALIDLLDNRLPIRAVGYWRDFHPDRTVLRYQDAALEILGELLPVSFPMNTSTGSYYSREDAQDRERIAKAYRAWWKENGSKSEEERLLAAVDPSGIHGALRTLEALAEFPGWKEKVLAKLGEMYKTRHWVFAPRIAELMAKLGDESKVAEVLRLYRDGKYSKFYIKRPDDSAASSNAEEAAKRLQAKYGGKD